MKLAILSRNSKLYSTRRLVEAARQRGHTVRVLDPLRCYMRISSRRLRHALQGQADRRLQRGDPAHRRVDHPLRHRGAAPVRTDGQLHARIPPIAILRARDKLRCHQLLAAQGIGLPVTVFGDNPDDTVDLLSMLGPPPHVIKLNEGTQGAGVMLTEKPSASRSVIEALRGLYANFLVQEFIDEAEGADLRCFVVGDQRGRGDAPAGAAGRFPLQPASRRQRPRRSRRPPTSRRWRCARRGCWAWAWPAWT